MAKNRKLIHIITKNGAVMAYLYLTEDFDSYYPQVYFEDLKFLVGDGKYKTLFEMKDYELKTLRKQVDNS